MDPETQRIQEEAEEEKARAKARAQGTPVTRATFAAWRERFDAEHAAAHATAAAVLVTVTAAVAAADREDRITGKQWFLERDRADNDVDEELEAEELEAEDFGGDLEGEGASGIAGNDWSDESGEAEDTGLEGIESDDEDFLDEFLAAAEEGV
jgi:hypothetical protein